MNKVQELAYAVPMPRETLTRDQIIRTAIELLDAEGLDGLNMRALGARLDSAATAVYWHVENKENLVRLAGDRVWSEIPLPELDGGDWRDSATVLATGVHTMLNRHAWLGPAFGAYLFYGPGKAGFDDRSIAVYEKAGFSAAEADQAAGTVLMFTLGAGLSTSMEISLTRRIARGGGDPEKQLRETMEAAAEIAKDFPYLRERLNSTAATDYAAAPDNSFEFGLSAILDGFAAKLKDSGRG